MNVHECMYVCMCLYMCIYVYMYVYVQVYMCCLFIGVSSVCMGMYECMGRYVHVSGYVWMYVCMHVCICVCVYLYVYIHSISSVLFENHVQYNCHDILCPTGTSQKDQRTKVVMDFVTPQQHKCLHLLPCFLGVLSQWLESDNAHG